MPDSEAKKSDAEICLAAGVTSRISHQGIMKIPRRNRHVDGNYSSKQWVSDIWRNRAYVHICNTLGKKDCDKDS
jgi:hypothetical protein